MKPLLALLLTSTFFFSLPVPARAAAAITSVTVAAQTINDWRFGGATAKLRVYASETFEQSGSFVIGSAPGSGSWYKQIDCTVAGTVLSIPHFSLLVTTTSSHQNASYTFVFVDANGTERGVYLSGIKVPDTYGANVTFAQLFIFSTSKAARPRPYEIYSKDQVNALLASVNGAPVATNTIQGKARLSVAAASSSDPIVAGDNDPRLAAASTINRGTVTTTTNNSTVVSTDDSRLGGTPGSVTCAGTNDTAALSAAIAAGGTVRITKGNTCATNNITFPATVELEIQQGGLLKPITGQKATLAGPFSAPVSKVFDNALAGQGTVEFTSRAVQEIYPEWWGASPSASAATNTPALQAMIIGAQGAMRTNPSGEYIYNRRVKLNGMYDINDKLNGYHWIGFHWEGQNRFNSGIRQTATDKQIIDGQSVAYGVFSNLHFQTNASQNTALIDLDYDGSQGEDLRPQQISFENITLSGNNVGYIGVRLAKSGGGAQSDNIYFTKFIASGFTQAAFQLGGGADGNPTALAYNAIYVRFSKGDIQSCPKYGIAVYGGSILLDGVTFENQTLDAVGFPTQTGADILTWGPQNQMDIRNVRSESLRFIQGFSANLTNITMAPYGTPWYSAGGHTLSGTVAYVNQLVTGTATGGNGKLYKVTTAPAGSTEPAQTVIAPFSTSVLTISPGGLTVNAWVNHWVKVTYPNCFVTYGTIASNTASTLTMVSPIAFLPGDGPGQPCGPSTTAAVFSNPGDPFPRWGGLPITDATGGSSTTIVKSSAGWGVNAFTGKRASIVAGKGKYQYCVITSNTSDTITCSGGWVTDYEHEFLYPDFAIVAPDATSDFVVEPDWGTQTSDGSIQWTAFDFNVIDGVPTIGLPFSGSIDGFRGSQGGKINGSGRFKDVAISRSDAFIGGVLPFDHVLVTPQMENVQIRRVVNGDDPGIPYLVRRNAGNQTLGPGSSQRSQGTEWIMWQAGQYGGGVTFTDVGLGRGDDQFSLTANKDILAFKGKLGRRTARGTNQAGELLQIQGGLSTGTGAPGAIEFLIGSSGSSGASVNSPSAAAGIGPNKIFYTVKTADVAAAGTIAPSGNVFTVTGASTTISTISATGITAGTTLSIVTASPQTFDEAGNLDVSGATSMTTGSNSLVLATWDGSKWRLLSSGFGAKTWRALLSQSGTNAPTASVLENSLGGTIVLARSAAGSYTLTLSGAFPQNKVWFSPSDVALSAGTFHIERTSDNVLTITTVDDSLLANFPLEIIVYP